MGACNLPQEPSSATGELQAFKQRRASKTSFPPVAKVATSTAGGLKALSRRSICMPAASASGGSKETVPSPEARVPSPGVLPAEECPLRVPPSLQLPAQIQTQGADGGGSPRLSLPSSSSSSPGPGTPLEGTLKDVIGLKRESVEREESQKPAPAARLGRRASVGSRPGDKVPGRRLSLTMLGTPTRRISCSVDGSMGEQQNMVEKVVELELLSKDPYRDLMKVIAKERTGTRQSASVESSVGMGSRIMLPNVRKIVDDAPGATEASSPTRAELELRKQVRDRLMHKRPTLVSPKTAAVLARGSEARKHDPIGLAEEMDRIERAHFGCVERSKQSISFSPETPRGKPADRILTFADEPVVQERDRQARPSKISMKMMGYRRQVSCPLTPTFEEEDDEIPRKRALSKCEQISTGRRESTAPTLGSKNFFF